MLWYMLFWISFVARALLTAIDLLETRNFRIYPDRRSRNAARLYGINKIRQLPLLAVAFVSAIGIGGLHFLLCPVLAVEIFLFAKAAQTATGEFTSGKFHFPRPNLAMQIAEAVLIACLALICFTGSAREA